MGGIDLPLIERRAGLRVFMLQGALKADHGLSSLQRPPRCRGLRLTIRDSETSLMARTTCGFE